MKKPSIIEAIKPWWHEVGHLNYDQRNFLIDLLLDLKPRYCLETGFCTGRSAVTVLISANPEVLVSIDILFGSAGGSMDWAKVLMDKFPALHVIDGDSREVLINSFFDKWFPNGIDFAFIDGGHSYTECYGDILAALTHLRPKGVIVVDDYMSGSPNGVSLESVNIAVDDIVDFYDYLSLEKWYRNGKGMAVLRK